MMRSAALLLHTVLRIRPIITPRAMTSVSGDTDVGYRILRGVLDVREASELLRSLDTSQLPHSRAGVRHLMHHAGVNQIANIRAC